MATNEPTNTPLDELEAAIAGETWGSQRITRSGRRDVITAFVRNPSNSSILLVKRSEKVNTYKLHWGGVSGVVEGDENLLKRAEREVCLVVVSTFSFRNFFLLVNLVFFNFILSSAFLQILEEVGYASDQLNFIHTGRPLYVDDNSGNLYFAVHAFLFDLRASNNANDDSSSLLKLNWENVDAQFVPPESLQKSSEHQPQVPRLSETLDRVLLTPKQESIINKLKSDRDHGAAQLAVWIVDALEQEIHRFREQNSGNPTSNETKGPLLIEHLRNFGYHLSCCRPSMAPLATTTARVLSSLHRSLHNMASPFDVTVEEVCLVALHAIDKERENLKTLNSRLLRHASELINHNMTIMTFSKSSSVSAVVNEALKQERQGIKIIICESRPLCEGVTAAEHWVDAGAEVTVITDAQAAVFIRHADMVLVGADAVNAEQVYNKVGTHLLALAAKEAKVPFYALADSSKIYPGNLEKLSHPGKVLGEELGEEKGKEEVIQGWPSGFKSAEGGESRSKLIMRNVYFEATPLDLVTAVVTEYGVMDAERIGKEVERIKEVYVEAFQLEI